MTDLPGQRSLILGPDGIHWDLLSSWGEQGKLPHFNELFENLGIRPTRNHDAPDDDLRVALVVTGVRLNKHGIYFFRRLTGSYTHKTKRGQLHSAADAVGYPLAVDRGQHSKDI